MAWDHDLFVIGGGSGGVRAARIAAGEHGARVALAEEDRMGGTCVIRGCVPKKLMVFAADHGKGLTEARGYGWQVGPAAFDWPAFRSALEAELNRLEAAYGGTLDRAGVQVFKQRATLAGPNAVRLADGRVVTAGRILIATGGRPWVPPEFDLPGVWTSDDIFRMDRLPGTILIVGGGYIACEFAGALAGMGVRVTQFYRGAQILRGFDDDLRHHVAAEMAAQGLAIETETDVAALAPRAGGGFTVTDTRGAVRGFDAVLFATGRRPNIAGLGLEAAGVALTGAGAVAVDAASRTSVASVFAVGDVTDRLALTPVAIREGHAFADSEFGNRPWQADHALVPTAVFTRPEIGTVGLTEAEARARGPVRIFRTSFRPMQSLFAGSPARCLMKLVVCAETDRVLGVHLAAPGAGEMIQMVGIAVKMGATKAQFDATMAVHPTLAEELVTMRQPAG